MDDDVKSHLLTKIGERMSRSGSEGSSKYFYYLEVEEGMLSPALYQEFPDRAVRTDITRIELFPYDLWLNSEPRWGAMRFDLDGDAFTATFDYDVDPTDGHTDERAAAAVKARFGDKPTVYLSEEEERAQRYRNMSEWD